MDSGTRTTVIPTPLGSPLRWTPFRAQRLSPQRIGDPQSARAFARPYTDVAQRLRRWEAQGHVLRSPVEAFHLHEYTVAGLTTRGLVGLLDLTHLAGPSEPPGLFPHEDVHPDQVRELAQRMEEMSMNPAPILLVHEGPAELRALIHQLVVADPDTTFTDRQGNQHRLWTIDDDHTVAKIQDLLAPAQIMIADGHHRYGAYLELARRHPHTGFGQGLAMVVDQKDTPLFLGAIHRVLPTVPLRELLDWASDSGARVTACADQDAAVQLLDNQTLAVGESEHWAAVMLPPGTEVSAVEWLSGLLDLHDDPEVEFHHSVESALAAERGTITLLPSPSLARIAHVAASGGVLPEKATSFQPKPPLGVMMRQVPRPTPTTAG